MIAECDWIAYRDLKLDRDQKNRLDHVINQFGATYKKLDRRENNNNKKH